MFINLQINNIFFKRIIKIIILYIISLFLLGCIKPYTVPVTQGKKILTNYILEIQPNMSKSEVIQILGSPDIIDTFNTNKFIYINTYKKYIWSTHFFKSKLILIFNNQDTLVGISGNYAPPTKEAVF